MVVSQQAAERARFADLAIRPSDFGSGIDDGIADALVVAPSMRVLGVGDDGNAQGANWLNCNRSRTCT